ARRRNDSVLHRNDSHDRLKCTGSRHAVTKGTLARVHQGPETKYFPERDCFSGIACKGPSAMCAHDVDLCSGSACITESAFETTEGSLTVLGRATHVIRIST